MKSSTKKYLSGLNAYFREEHIPALRLCLDGDEIVIGEGGPQGTLHASWFEVFRTISGRRTPDQVRKLTWDGDPEIWIDHLFVLGPATSDQIE